jgi:hypothetical protein
LLEDVFRLYNGLPPRKDPNYFYGGPYLGPYSKSGYREIVTDRQDDADSCRPENQNSTKFMSPGQENYNIVNFNKDGTGSDYHMTLKSNYKHNQDPNFKSKANGFKDSTKGTLEISTKGDRKCYSEIGNDQLYNEGFGKGGIGFMSPMSGANFPQSKNFLGFHGQNLMTEPKLHGSDQKNPNQDHLVRYQDEKLKFSHLESQLPQGTNAGAFRIKEEAEPDYGPGHVEPETVDVATMKLCVEFLLICDMTKVVEKTEWTSSVWETFENG